MNITPIANYLQVRKINQQKYTTRNINFGMAKLDQVQLSKSKDDYYRQAREDYIGHFWTFHPEDEQYVPKLGSEDADKKHFIDNCSEQEMKEVLSAKKYGINKDQNFYQAGNYDGCCSLGDKYGRLILDEISKLPALEDGEQQKTILSELAKANISEFKEFFFNNIRHCKQQACDAILKADTFLWDTLDTETKYSISTWLTKETKLKLVAQEMEKLPEATSEKSQESTLTGYAQRSDIWGDEFLSLIEGVDKKTLISWMKKDNVFIKKLGVYGVMKLVEIIGVEEFDKLYSKKYGKLFDSFFDPNAKKQAIESFGVDRYKKLYGEKYGDLEKIEYDAYLYCVKNAEYGLEVLKTLKSSKFKELKPEYQADFIIRILNGEIRTYLSGKLDRTTFDDDELQNLVEDYAINNENVSIEDSIKILECLLMIYSELTEKLCGERKRNITERYRIDDRINHYQDRIIHLQVALQELEAQIQ